MDNHIITLPKDKPLILANLLYVKYYNNIIYADTCHILNDCAILLYKDRTLVSSITKPIEKVEELNGTEEHTYILRTKTTHSFMQECIYLFTKKKQKGNLISVGTLVLHSDDALKMYMAFTKDETIFERLGKEIEKNLMWTVDEIIEGKWVKISKDGKIVFSPIDTITSLEDIITQAKKQQEKKI